MTREEALAELEPLALLWTRLRPREEEALRIVLAMTRAFGPMLEALEAVEFPIIPEGCELGICAPCGRRETRKHADFCPVGRALALARKETT